MSNNSGYYSLKEILKRKAHYNVIFGERSNGKTYAVLLYALKAYVKTGKQLAIVRRFREDFRGKRGQELFRGIVTNNEVSKATKGAYTGIYHYGDLWYLSAPDGKGGVTRDEKPFAIGFAISEMEHDKGSSYPYITTVLFDEFMTRESICLMSSSCFKTCCLPLYDAGMMLLFSCAGIQSTDIARIFGKWA